MTNCDWFFSIECSAPESEVRSHSNSCEGPPPEPQPQLLLWCWSCACKHSKQYSRHTSRDVQAFWNVSFISHSLTGSPNLFVSLSFANSPSLSLSSTKVDTRTTHTCFLHFLPTLACSKTNTPLYVYFSQSLSHTFTTRHTQ